jgi:hypothetical protein
LLHLSTHNQIADFHLNFIFSLSRFETFFIISLSRMCYCQIMKLFYSKIGKLPGTNYQEVYSNAYSIYKSFVSKTKRKPYIRSKYFHRQKIFLDFFWSHIHQKNMRDRTRRLKYYACALDLIRNNLLPPISENDKSHRSRKWYRFAGRNSHNEVFFVQIMEDINNRQKYFISTFPDN